MSAAPAHTRWRPLAAMLALAWGVACAREGDQNLERGTAVLWAARAAEPVLVTALGPSLDLLAAAFERDAGRHRLIVLLAPT